MDNFRNCAGGMFGGTRYIDTGTGTGDGVDGGSAGLPPVAEGSVVRVYDGAVKGAAVYFDTNGDGTVSEAEREAQRDGEGRPVYVTNEDGEVAVPEQFQNRYFVADVNGATDTATGEKLVGEYKSLSTGELATPITDLIAESGETPQDVLSQIFGEDSDISIDDILNTDHYAIQAADAGPDAAAAPGVEASEEDIAEYEDYLSALNLFQKTQDITTLALALTELDQDDTLITDPDSGAAATDNVAHRIAILNALFDDDDQNDGDLGQRVQDRVDQGRDVLEGRPVAAPDPFVVIDEDTTLTVGDFTFGGQYQAGSRQAIETFFGFVDPQENSDTEVVSAFRGILINANLSDGRIDIDGSPLSSDILAQGEARPSTSGLRIQNISDYVYVSYGMLRDLEFVPNPDYFGALEVDYYVYDGAEWSLPATLNIAVNSVNDLPEITAVSGDRDASESQQYVLSDEGYIVDPDGNIEGVITVSDVEDTGFSPNAFTLSGADRDLFEIVFDGTNLRIKLKDDATPKAPGENYDISLVVTDSDGGVSAEIALTITQGGFYLEDNAGIRTYSNGDALIDEAADGSVTAIVLGTIGIEGVDIANTSTTTTRFSTNSDGLSVTESGGEWQMQFDGANAGDFDGASPDILEAVITKTVIEHVVTGITGFTGIKDADASGDAADGDDRTYSLKTGEGVISVDTDSTVDGIIGNGIGCDGDGNVFAIIDVTGGDLVFTAMDDQGQNVSQNVTFAAASLTITEASLIIVDNANGDGSYAVRALAVDADRPEGDYYVLGQVGAPQIPEDFQEFPTLTYGDITVTAPQRDSP